MLQIGKFIERECNNNYQGLGVGVGDGDLVFNGNRVSAGDDKKDLHMDGGHRGIILCLHLMQIMIHTVNSMLCASYKNPNQYDNDL